MATANWEEIYESYTGEELEAEIANLKKQNSVFVSQQVGGKSFTKDLRLLEEKLQAAVRVRNKRNAPEDAFTGRADFSGM